MSTLLRRTIRQSQPRCLAPLSRPQRATIKTLSSSQRAFLEQALRVNQAGELGANLIYAGQYSVLKHDARLRPVIAHMWDQEKGHLDKFNELLAKHRVRPTALRPIWNVAGYALGVATAMMGEKAAMACTEAVETEIGGHYNGQIRELLEIMQGVEGSAEMEELVGVIRRFRDEELEHLDTAVEGGAKETKGYELLSGAIRGGCKAAIWLSEKI